MLDKYNIFTLPKFENSESERLAQLLTQVIWGFQVLSSITLILGILILPQNIVRWLALLSIFNAIAVFVHILNNKGFYRLASSLFVIFSICLVFVTAWSAGGNKAPITIGLSTIVLISSFLLGKKVAVFSTIVVIAGGFFLFLSDFWGWLPESMIQHTPLSLWVISIMWVLIVFFLQNLYWDSLSVALKSAIFEIAKRKQIEEDLVKSESFRRKIFEQSNLPTIIIDGDTNLIIEGNKAALEAFKLSNQSALNGSSFLDFSASLQYDGTTSAEKLYSYIGDAKQNDSYRFEWRNRYSDGTFWDSEAHLTSFNNDGKVLLQLVLLDVTEKKQINRTFYKLSNDFASFSDKEFFEAICRYISMENGLDYVYVGELNKQNTSIELLGGFALGAPMENFSYKLKDTPCSHVMDSQTCIFPKGVQQLFPQDHLLKKMNVIGYIGLPIYGDDKKPVGIFVTLNLRPLENSEKTLSFLNLFTERISSEFKRFKAQNELLNEIAHSQKLEKELRENKSRLQTISDNFKEGLIYQVAVQPNGERCFTFLSQSVSDIFGVSPENGIKNSSLIYNRIFEADLEGFANAENSALQRMASFTYEARFYDKNNEIIWISLVSSPKVMENGLVSWDGIGQVITQRKKAEEELIRSQDRFRNLIKYSPFPMSLTTLDGEFIMVNQEFLKVVNLSENDVLGKSTTLLGYSIDQAATEAIANLRATSENIDNLEIYLNNENGLSFIFLLSSRIIEWDKSSYIINSLVNITEKKKLEDELSDYRNNLELLVKQRTLELANSNISLQQANKLLSKEREELSQVLKKLNATQEKLIQAEKFASLGVLASGIAHEINNPLNFINGGILGIETLLNDENSSLASEMKPFIDAINIGVERASKIVKGLNHYSQKDEDLMTTCDMNSIMENCITIFKGQVRSEINLIYTQAKKPCLVSGNEGKLHKALLVVIANAEQAIAHKGTIYLATEISDDYVDVIIRDNGVGISDENLKRLYDPFFTTKSPGEGTGLGLSIALKIIQDHNGTIEHKSKIGEGTTVTIRIPKIF